MTFVVDDESSPDEIVVTVATPHGPVSVADAVQRWLSVEGNAFQPPLKLSNSAGFWRREGPPNQRPMQSEYISAISNFLGISWVTVFLRFLSSGTIHVPRWGRRWGRMSREIQKLSARKAASLSAPGRHSDGAGLYLNVTPSGAKSWIFMFKVEGRRREMGLGSARDVSLSQARKLASEARQHLIAGRDPISEIAKPKSITFGTAARSLIDSMSPSWRNAKHRAQWTMTLTVYCAPLAQMPVAAVTTDDVLKVLKPLWLAKPETAARLRGRIERVLDFAKARGMRTGENPARWRGHLNTLLPKRQMLTRGHHKAMPFDEVPSFIERLRQSDGVAPKALEFTILTAARSGEVLGAEWSEVNLNSRLWTVPASRMKGARPHRVPLSGHAIEILEPLAKLRTSDFVFPGSKPGKPLSSMALEMVLRRLRVEATVHGFRSAFRDWVEERTTFAREVAEAALAHLVGDEVERAYRRGDAVEKRMSLMQAWADFCHGSTSEVLIFPPRTKLSA